MAGAPGVPQNFAVQTANQQNLISWDLTTGATSYLIQSSLDNITYTTLVTLAGTPLATSYVDTAASLGVQIWYQVQAINAFGSSGFTASQSAVPTPTGEMCLSQIRLAAMQRADRVNSNFVTNSEWRNYINQAMFELYDLLVTVYEDYYAATPVQFVSDGSTFNYPLPNGTLSFLSGINVQQTIVGEPFYKLLGVDLALQNVNNGYATINKFNFIDRNRYIYPNTGGSLYGVFNLQYRVIGKYIQFIPTPSAGQAIRLWYIPRLKELLLDTDTTTVGISGWVEYVIVKAAYYALTKEESDTSSLVMQLAALQKRIEESANNRDAGQPDNVSDTRGVNGGDWGFGSGSGYGKGGF